MSETGRPFDELKAAREELAGLHDVVRTLVEGEQKAEMDIAAAERNLNSIRKLKGYARIEVERLRAHIRELEMQ